ncbi:SDR family oxidoreductase [Marinobacter nanhaiticus D15-8W]|uniref:SDR family oxidoreductase n=1 Tax=Marinobacter nanhaiticus D15-8W TaxID=626887 RepID=N6W8C5_9GAMM|nr:SDR family oxidoreductase [Marinobacter nanhaiticus]ENO16529.1 SDR family oxidoreductase [Marinobacter nanhaiticus D15-8W]BES72320.1 SDR family oxidoreductase [Marinobacter nanhaiticus D15-8W]
MRVLIAGANGKIGQHLIKKMAHSPHEAVAMVRDPDQAEKLRELGAPKTVLGDLERDCTEQLKGCDAVVFTAGSGPHTGPEKTIDVDQDGAIRLIDSAKAAGVKRFIMVSAMRAEEPDKGPEKIRHYLRAKHRADEHLRAGGISYTIVRPGPLTQSAGAGKVEISEKLDRTGDISREDVAEVLLKVLDAPNAENRTLDVLSGDASIDEAVKGF